MTADLDAFTTGGRAEKHAAFWDGRRIPPAAWPDLHDHLTWAGYELVDEPTGITTAVHPRRRSAA